MKVCLMNAPTAVDFDDPKIADLESIRILAEDAPLGILSLAAVLERGGAAPGIVDLNHLYRDWLSSDERREGIKFATYAATPIAARDEEFFGFSTICSSYPLTLRIAGELRRLRPGVTIAMGGPQASVVDVATMRAFPFIDLIVRGEAEESFPELLDALARGRPLRGIRGVTYRANGAIERNPDAEPIADLESLPLPAYHLHPHGFQRSHVPIEVGRGCPYQCTFCSTSTYFRRRFRLKSPAHLLGQMRQLRDRFDVKSFDLSHDMFTANRRKVIEFCETLLASGEDFLWSCSARSDSLDEELLTLMAKAGCRGIFVGVETGSPRMQKIIRKNLDVAQAEANLRVCDRLEIGTAIALIVGFPEETMDDVRATVGIFVDALRYDYGEPQIGMLAPLAETPIYREHKDHLIFDDVIPDMSFQGWRQDTDDAAMVREHPEIFPNFYGVPTPHLDRHLIKELRDFLLNGMSAFRWLMVGLHHDAGSLVDVFVQWRAWRQAHRTPLPGDGVTKYYAQRRFRADFLEFVRTEYLPRRAHATAALATLMDYELSIDEAEPDAVCAPAPCNRAEATLSLDSRPRVASRLQVTALNADYQAIIRRLREKQPLPRVRKRSVTVVTGDLPDQARGRILQLSSLSAKLLSFCDGRPVRDIAAQFAQEHLAPEGVPADATCLYGIEALRRQGLVEIAAAEG